MESIAFSLQSCIEQIQALMSPSATKKNLTIELVFDPNLPERIIADPVRLHQVLLNLTSNAVKFSQDGQVKIISELVNSSAGDTDACEIRFAVTDTGIGIPLEAQARLFDAFSQVDGSTTRKYGGSGLGLTIARQLVELMGGRAYRRKRAWRRVYFFFYPQNDLRSVFSADDLDRFDN